MRDRSGYRGKPFRGREPGGEDPYAERGDLYGDRPGRRKFRPDGLHVRLRDQLGRNRHHPYTTARKITGQKNISSLEIYIENTEYTDQLSDEVEGVLYQAFNQNEDSYFVFAMDSLLDTMNEMMSMLTYMLAGIASIALLVGGIGIMNMMLVSVSERKQEIGLRKAMGATPGRIQMQFLLESVVLSLIGGIIGVILGLLISVAAAALMDTDFVFSVSAVALGVGFSTAVGIIFGWAPARKASRLSPIDALRSE